MKFLTAMLTALFFSGAAMAATQETTKEEQLAGCPAVIEVYSVPNSNITYVTGVSRDCWAALYGTQGGDDKDSADE